MLNFYLIFVFLIASSRKYIWNVNPVFNCGSCLSFAKIRSEQILYLVQCIIIIIVCFCISYNTLWYKVSVRFQRAFGNYYPSFSNFQRSSIILALFTWGNSTGLQRSVTIENTEEITYCSFSVWSLFVKFNWFTKHNQSGLIR